MFRISPDDIGKLSPVVNSIIQDLGNGVHHRTRVVTVGENIPVMLVNGHWVNGFMSITVKLVEKSGNSKEY